MTFESDDQKVSKKFLIISNKYHKLSQLFYELSKSIEIASKNKSPPEFKKYLKSLNLDLNKIKQITKGMSEIELNDIQFENEKTI